MKWLAECSAEAFGEALRVVAPQLSGCPVTVPVPHPAAQADPLYWASSAVVGERLIAKFAWSRPAALRLAREIGVLTAFAREPRVPFCPRWSSADRVMAWPVRTALGDVLWRSEAGIPLADQRTPPEWVDDLAARFSAFGVDPETLPATNQDTTRRANEDR